MEKSRWQAEYDALPAWARELVDALKPCSGHGGGGDEGVLGHSTKIYFSDSEQAWRLMSAIGDTIDFARALSAPWPPPKPPPVQEHRVLNIVELMSEDDSGFDQVCAYGWRVETHAVYCHCEAWPDHPRKCRRNREDFLHEDCPGFVANPALTS